MSKQQAIEQTRHYLLLAKQLLQQDFLFPAINFDLTGKSAGYFKRLPDGSCEINYNRQLLNLHTQDFLQRTIPHEVAHLVAYQVHGIRIKPHGNEWKSIMELFAADSSRCHSYDVSKLKTRQYRRFLYQCSCRSHQLSSIRHNRVISGQRYVCKQCKQQLSYQGHA